MNKRLMKDVKHYLATHGRPLELSLYNYHFEDADLNDVFKYLTEFQNSDGGFGHGLEPDFLTPESNPIDTWTAINIIRSLDLNYHPLIDQMVDYLIQCPYQKNELYDSVIPSNNLHPHAPWWHYENEVENSYNPTASLLGFMYKHLRSESPYKPIIHHRVLKAVQYFLDNDVTEMHELRCFVELYHDISETFEASQFSEKLKKQILKTVNQNADAWFNSYTVRPSQLIINHLTPGYHDIQSLVHLEHQLLFDNRNALGVWSITWDWSDQNKAAFERSRLAWQGVVALQYLLRFRAF